MGHPIHQSITNTHFLQFKTRSTAHSLVRFMHQYVQYMKEFKKRFLILKKLSNYCPCRKECNCSANNSTETMNSINMKQTLLKLGSKDKILLGRQLTNTRLLLLLLCCFVEFCFEIDFKESCNLQISFALICGQVFPTLLFCLSHTLETFFFQDLCNFLNLFLSVILLYESSVLLCSIGDTATLNIGVEFLVVLVE